MSHKHYNNLEEYISRTYLNSLSLLEGIYLSINISKVLNFKNVLKMLVLIGPHSLNTLRARVIDMKLYCNDVMGGA